MEANWISVILAAVFWVASMKRMMRWQERSRLAPDQIVQPRAIPLIGFLSFQFCAGVLIVANALPNCTVTIWTDLGFAGFGFASLYMVADYFNSRFAVDDEGMRFGRASGQHGSFLWRDVEHIAFSQTRGAYRITLRSGLVLNVHQASTQVSEFAHCILRQVPSTRIAPDTWSLLTDAADGRLLAS